MFDINASQPEHSFINLLATASNFGLVVVGSPTNASFDVVLLKDVVERKKSETIPKRTIPLPAPPQNIGLSCDHAQLAVSYSANGSSFIRVYDVKSFLSSVSAGVMRMMMRRSSVSANLVNFQNVRSVLQDIRVSPEENVKVSQILWNPVIPNTMATCLNNGQMCMYVIKDGSYEFYTIDKSEQARYVFFAEDVAAITIN